MTLPKRFLSAAGAALLLAACNSAEEKAMERMIEDETGQDAVVDMDRDGTMRVETDEGTFVSDDEVPEDWPADVSIYGDAKVEYSATVNPTTGKPGSVLVMTTEDAAADVAAYYREELADAGWEIEGDMRMGEMTILSGKKDGRVVSVMISEAEGGTSITLGVGEDE